MVPALVGAEAVKEAPDALRLQAALPVGQGEDLVAPGLDRAGLVAADVARRGGEDPLPRLQQAADHGGVRLRAAGEEEHVRLRGAAGLPDLLPGGLGKLVQPVARGADQVGLRQALQDLGVAPGRVVRGEKQSVHGGISFAGSYLFL